MNGIKSWLLVCAWVSLAACDDAGFDVGDAGEVDEGAGDAGGMGGMGGDGGGGGVDPTPVPWVVIFDGSEGDSGNGTAGADICGAEAICSGARLLGTEARLTLGDGEVCAAEGPGCSTSRSDPDAALDDGVACEAASAPSDYVSLGLSGVLAIDFGQDLRGCQVTIREFEGADPESIDVFVCDAAEVGDDTFCVNADAPLASGAGEIAFAVPE